MKNLFALALPVLVACAGASAESADVLEEGETEGALATGAARDLIGAYRLPGDAFGAIVLLDDGSFIHDQPRVLNGMIRQGEDAAPLGRDEGRWSVNGRKKTLTLRVKSGWHEGAKEVYSFEQKVVPLNGMFIGRPPSNNTLTLTKGTSSLTYRSTDSWCHGGPIVSTRDCTRQASHGVWSAPSDTALSCGDDNTCTATPAGPPHGP